MPVVVLVLSVAATLVFAADEPTRTTEDGVYTVEQADRGKQSYQRSCAACHPLDWYRGDIMKAWAGGSLKDLYDALSVKMPPTNPGSLKRREYVALLAYILALNEMPAGSEELPETPEALQKVVIKWRNKP